MELDSTLFIKKLKLDREKIENFNNYPFNIEVVKNFHELELKSPVTFFIGDNGIGKSTFIEAIAIACGLNPECGSQNFTFSTKNTHSNLHEYLHAYRYNKPKTKFFLRAESFYNVSRTL